METDHATLGDVLEPSGTRAVAFVRMAGGRQPGKEFLDTVPIRVYRRFRGLMRSVAEGHPPAGTMYFLVTDSDKIHAFRVAKWWLFAFADRDRFVLLCGGAEVTGRLRRRVVKQAERLRNDYITGQKVTALPCRRKAQNE